ncbi:SGNH/GDSL hydrolase family protein [Longimicrobium sp.]|uniref:SGNH/GDSL hydrolase family protein n=1 Tax=Longimicrobium sp. TaxID=2029185 RepID=UPI002C66FC24|nr:SGNH/GDSL hydrolase family protein [Longimicrobium sp.]HSU14195.1 SGNH/GDSL hydrolase family protein [Longimicrobium sp.]
MRTRILESSGWRGEGGAWCCWGDSILDNGAYTSGGPQVAAQVQAVLPDGWRCVLAAVDGATTGDVPRQMGDVPDDAAVLVLSAGGNDLLMHVNVLDEPATGSAQVLARLAELADGFEVDYRAMLRHVMAAGLPLVLCTVYNGGFPDARMARLAATAMAVFDDRILRVALEHGLPVIELRAVCNRPEDYANPIEPSSIGGEKIARAIARVVAEHDFTVRWTVIYT